MAILVIRLIIGFCNDCSEATDVRYCVRMITAEMPRLSFLSLSFSLNVALHKLCWVSGFSSVNTPASLGFISLSSHLTALCVLLLVKMGQMQREGEIHCHLSRLRCLFIVNVHTSDAAWVVRAPFYCASFRHACTHMYKHTKDTLEQMAVLSTQ